MTGLKYLSNEVDILVYQLSDGGEVTQRGSRPNLNIQDQINEVHLENIRRDCERKKWIEEKNLDVVETKEIKQYLNKHLTSYYNGQSQSLYAQYLGSHLTVGFNFKLLR